VDEEGPASSVVELADTGDCADCDDCESIPNPALANSDNLGNPNPTIPLIPSPPALTVVWFTTPMTCRCNPFLEDPSHTVSVEMNPLIPLESANVALKTVSLALIEENEVDLAGSYEGREDER
jgi:hypothetical protein